MAQSVPNRDGRQHVRSVAHLNENEDSKAKLPELTNKNLGCQCPRNQACHIDSIIATWKGWLEGGYR